MSLERIFIVGAGPVGQTLAARLALQNDVRMLTRRSWAELGILPSGALVILTPKAYDLEAALQQLVPHLSQADSKTTVLLCQNGLNQAKRARALLPESVRLARATCWFGARLDGERLQISGDERIELAAETAELSERIAALFETSGFGVRRFKTDISRLEWRKALLNITINGLCALAAVPNRQAAEDPVLRRIAEALLSESLSVARAHGISLLPEDSESVFPAAQATGANLNSTYQDLKMGRRTEIPWLNGIVVALAHELKIQAPANQLITHQLSVSFCPKPREFFEDFATGISPKSC